MTHITERYCASNDSSRDMTHITERYCASAVTCHIQCPMEPFQWNPTAAPSATSRYIDVFCSTPTRAYTLYVCVCMCVCACYTLYVCVCACAPMYCMCDSLHVWLTVSTCLVLPCVPLCMCAPLHVCLFTLHTHYMSYYTSCYMLETWLMCGSLHSLCLRVLLYCHSSRDMTHLETWLI